MIPIVTKAKKAVKLKGEKKLSKVDPYLGILAGKCKIVGDIVSSPYYDDEWDVEK